MSSHKAHKAKPAAERLAAKIALITGGSRGIGAADCPRAVLSYKGNRAAADEAVSKIAEHGGTGMELYLAVVAHYSNTQPVMSQLRPGMKMSLEQREMIANHIADFSIGYLRAQPAEFSTSALPTSPRKHR